MKRDKTIKIRVNDDELALLNERKQKPELARWMREYCLSAESIQIKHSVDPELLRQLAGIGNNINQLTRNENIAAKGGSLTSTTERIKLLLELTRVEKALNAVLEQVGVS